MAASSDSRRKAILAEGQNLKNVGMICVLGGVDERFIKGYKTSA